MLPLVFVVFECVSFSLFFFLVLFFVVVLGVCLHPLFSFVFDVYTCICFLWFVFEYYSVALLCLVRDSCLFLCFLCLFVCVMFVDVS